MSNARDKRILAASSGIVIALAYLAKTLRRRKAPLYVLRNAGLEVHISAMGGIIQRLYVPDRNGKIDDIVLGHDTLDDYLVRTARRIACHKDSTRSTTGHSCHDED